MSKGIGKKMRKKSAFLEENTFWKYFGVVSEVTHETDWPNFFGNFGLAKFLESILDKF